MKRYVALFVSFVLVFSTGPVSGGFIDTLKGLIPGHHEQPVKQHVHPRAKSHSNPNKGDKPAENSSPNADTSPGAEESPAPSPVPVPSAEPTVDNNQPAAADQSPKPVSTPVTLQSQSSTATAPSVAIDPPPLY
jgi:hypothetical protein